MQVYSIVVLVLLINTIGASPQGPGPPKSTKVMKVKAIYPGFKIASLSRGTLKSLLNRRKLSQKIDKIDAKLNSLIKRLDMVGGNSSVYANSLGLNRQTDKGQTKVKYKLNDKTSPKSSSKPSSNKHSIIYIIDKSKLKKQKKPVESKTTEKSVPVQTETTTKANDEHTTGSPITATEAVHVSTPSASTAENKPSAGPTVTVQVSEWKPSEETAQVPESTSEGTQPSTIAPTSSPVTLQSSSKVTARPSVTLSITSDLKEEKQTQNEPKINIKEEKKTTAAPSFPSQTKYPTPVNEIITPQSPIEHEAPVNKNKIIQLDTASTIAIPITTTMSNVIKGKNETPSKGPELNIVEGAQIASTTVLPAMSKAPQNGPQILVGTEETTSTIGVPAVKDGSSKSPEIVINEGSSVTTSTSIVTERPLTTQENVSGNSGHTVSIDVPRVKVTNVNGPKILIVEETSSLPFDVPPKGPEIITTSSTMLSGHESTKASTVVTPVTQQPSDGPKLIIPDESATSIISTVANGPVTGTHKEAPPSTASPVSKSPEINTGKGQAAQLTLTLSKGPNIVIVEDMKNTSTTASEKSPAITTETPDSTELPAVKTNPANGPEIVVGTEAEFTPTTVLPEVTRTDTRVTGTVAVTVNGQATLPTVSHGLQGTIPDGPEIVIVEKSGTAPPTVFTKVPETNTNGRTIIPGKKGTTVASAYPAVKQHTINGPNIIIADIKETLSASTAAPEITQEASVKPVTLKGDTTMSTIVPALKWKPSDTPEIVIVEEAEKIESTIQPVLPEKSSQEQDTDKEQDHTLLPTTLLPEIRTPSKGPEVEIYEEGKSSHTKTVLPKGDKEQIILGPEILIADEEVIITATIVPAVQSEVSYPSVKQHTLNGPNIIIADIKETLSASTAAPEITQEASVKPVTLKGGTTMSTIVPALKWKPSDIPEIVIVEEAEKIESTIQPVLPEKSSQEQDADKEQDHTLLPTTLPPEVRTPSKGPEVKIYEEGKVSHSKTVLPKGEKEQIILGPEILIADEEVIITATIMPAVQSEVATEHGGPATSKGLPLVTKKPPKGPAIVVVKETAINPSTLLPYVIEGFTKQPAASTDRGESTAATSPHISSEQPLKVLTDGTGHTQSKMTTSSPIFKPKHPEIVIVDESVNPLSIVSPRVTEKPEKPKPEQEIVTTEAIFTLSTTVPSSQEKSSKGSVTDKEHSTVSTVAHTFNKKPQIGPEIIVPKESEITQSTLMSNLPKQQPQGNTIVTPKTDTIASTTLTSPPRVLRPKGPELVIVKQSKSSLSTVLPTVTDGRSKENEEIVVTPVLPEITPGKAGNTVSHEKVTSSNGPSTELDIKGHSTVSTLLHTSSVKKRPPNGPEIVVAEESKTTKLTTSSKITVLTTKATETGTQKTKITVAPSKGSEIGAGIGRTTVSTVLATVKHQSHKGPEIILVEQSDISSSTVIPNVMEEITKSPGSDKTHSGITAPTEVHSSSTGDDSKGQEVTMGTRKDALPTTIPSIKATSLDGYKNAAGNRPTTMSTLMTTISTIKRKPVHGPDIVIAEESKAPFSSAIPKFTGPPSTTETTQVTTKAATSPSIQRNSSKRPEIVTETGKSTLSRLITPQSAAWSKYHTEEETTVSITLSTMAHATKRMPLKGPELVVIKQSEKKSENTPLPELTTSNKKSMSATTTISPLEKGPPSAGNTKMTSKAQTTVSTTLPVNTYTPPKGSEKATPKASDIGRNLPKSSDLVIDEQREIQSTSSTHLPLLQSSSSPKNGLYVASQSSTSGQARAENAIDGVTSPDHGNFPCAQTLPDDLDPWWMVDFGSEGKTISGVRLYNRGDCCWEQLSHLQITVDNDSCAKYVGPAPRNAAQNAFIELRCLRPLQGNSLKIDKMGYDLTLCEVDWF